ncbi:hypothetical protein SBRCBS47491_008636 [Sporothrix bragantina]|uniref:FAD/NAD(P)-binding domain-containing protein n=1 Tax=Sporothrix bragantina TaxID=671064 RepID=A0ABP0CN39_9PEZI
MDAIIPPLRPSGNSTTNNTASVLIVGAGPAGVAAAMALARQQHSVLLFGDSVYRNGRDGHAHHSTIPEIEGRPSNFGPAARDNMLAQHGAYVSYREVTIVQVIQANVSSAFIFTVVDARGRQYHGRKLILASGVEDILLPIDGYAACFGRAIFPRLQCTGYEPRSRQTRRAGVLAVGLFAQAAVAVHVAKQAACLVTERVTVYTNGDAVLGEEIQRVLATTTLTTTTTIMVIDTRSIHRFVLLDASLRLDFTDGTSRDDSFLAHAPATRPRGPFVAQLGLALTSEGDIWVQLPGYRTSVPGVFAAGDNCTAHMKSVPHAMLSGHVAGMGAATQISDDVTAGVL